MALSTCSTCCASAAAGDIRVFGGGGGVIAEEADELHARGVARIYTRRRPKTWPSGHDRRHAGARRLRSGEERAG